MNKQRTMEPPMKTSRRKRVSAFPIETEGQSMASEKVSRECRERSRNENTTRAV